MKEDLELGRAPDQYYDESGRLAYHLRNFRREDESDGESDGIWWRI